MSFNQCLQFAQDSSAKDPIIQRGTAEQNPVQRGRQRGKSILNKATLVDSEKWGHDGYFAMMKKKGRPVKNERVVTVDHQTDLRAKLSGGRADLRAKLTGGGQADLRAKLTGGQDLRAKLSRRGAPPQVAGGGIKKRDLRHKLSRATAPTLPAKCPW